MKKRIGLLGAIAIVVAVAFAINLQASQAIEFRAFPAYVLTLDNVTDVSISGKDERGNPQNLKLVSPRMPIIKENGSFGTPKDVVAGKKALIVTDVADPRTTAYAIVLDPSLVNVPDWSTIIKEERDCTIDSYNADQDTLGAHSYRLRNAGLFYTSGAIYLRKDGTLSPFTKLVPRSKGSLVWFDRNGKHIVLLVQETN